MSTPTLSNKHQAAFNILNDIKTQKRDISSLNTSERETLYSQYTQDEIDCYSPFTVSANKSCCNRNYSKDQRVIPPVIVN